MYTGGVWHGRITYQEIDNLLQSFRARTQEEHHKGASPFTDLPIDMVKVFSLDYMHQSCLGVMRKFLLTWIKGQRETKLSAGQVSEVSTKLIQLQAFIPDSVASKPIGLEE